MSGLPALLRSKGFTSDNEKDPESLALLHRQWSHQKH